MNLTKVTIHGFKRFKDESQMYVDGKLVSIIGANEAGKSSFLNALVHWNDNEEFTRTGGKPELSRFTKIKDDQVIISCMFILDKNDKEALADIPEAVSVKSFLISKNASGSINSFIQPKRLLRDISSRESLRDIFNKAVKNKTSKFTQHFDDAIIDYNSNEDEDTLIIENIEDVLSVLDLEDETLDQNSINMLKSTEIVLREMSLIKAPKYVQGIPDLLIKTILNEERQTPDFAVKKILLARKPKFLLFGDEERTLKSDYQLDSGDEDGNEDSESDIDNIALNNLLEAAGLDVNELFNEVADDNRARVDTLVEKANNRLKEEFKSWKQSIVYPKLKLDNYRLTILFGNLDKGGYDSIAQRSEGLRQFVALFTFIKAQKSSVESPKVLLIDEAETHLHYDAQADFIQMLTEQDLVNKVIYTTHSMGCLPEDLGSGVRYIEQSQKEDEATSSIVNWFWEGNRPGFHSILYNMGASTLAFIPVRHALFAEGAVDHILLPTLFREASEQDHLGFQVAPGISIASEDQIHIMDYESPKTTYLIDSDHGERTLLDKLKNAGIPDNRVFSLPKRKSKGLSIEDLIDKSIYLEAVNYQLAKYNNDGFCLKIKDIPDFNRANRVDELCKGKNKPSKRDVAYSLLEMKANGDNILSNDMKEKIKELIIKIVEVFKNKS